MKIKTAKGLIALYMRTCGFRGWASFWSTVYLMPGSENDQALIRHESKHIEQIARDGRVVFAVKYLYWLTRYGYKNNRYEIEARAAE